MTKLDYEKQNRKEQPLEAVDLGHRLAATKHARKRKAAKKHQERTFVRGVEKGTAKGYQQGAKEMKEYLTEQIIHLINQDAVLRTTVDVETMKRVVKIIEAVRDIGKTQS